MQLTITDETWKRFRELAEDIMADRNFMKNGGRPLCRATRIVVDLVADSSIDHGSAAGNDVWDLLIEIVSLANPELAKLNEDISYEDFCAITAGRPRVDCLRAETRIKQQMEQLFAALRAGPEEQKPAPPF